MRINVYDSLDYDRLTQWEPRFGSYGSQAIDAAASVRGAANYEPFIFALPEDAAHTLDARGTYDGRLSVLPGSYITHITAASAQAAGMRVQITDLGTNATLFSKPLQYQNMSGQGSASGVTTPCYFLPIPKLVLEPGIIQISIQNLATVPNIVQVCLFVAQPEFFKAV